MALFDNFFTASFSSINTDIQKRTVQPQFKEIKKTCKQRGKCIPALREHLYRSSTALDLWMKWAKRKFLRPSAIILCRGSCEMHFDGDLVRKRCAISAKTAVPRHDKTLFARDCMIRSPTSPETFGLECWITICFLIHWVNAFNNFFYALEVKLCKQLTFAFLKSRICDATSSTKCWVSKGTKSTFWMLQEIFEHWYMAFFTLIIR